MSRGHWGRCSRSQTEHVQVFRLPGWQKITRAEATPLMSEVETSSTDASRGRVLVVDDDAVGSLVLCQWLRTKQYEVAQADSPANADPYLHRSGFDLIISDIVMPGNTRLEWVEALVAAGTGLPILLMTANPALETACRAANLRVAGYLIKPLDWQTLDATVQRLIGERRRQRDFLALKHEILGLLEGRDPQSEIGLDSAVVEKLKRIANDIHSTGGVGSTVANGRDADDRWRAAITDAIVVLEKTRHSFRSKELGQLRARLQQMV